MAHVDTDTAHTAPATVGAKENRVIWLLLAAAFVAILNETTMGVAIPHLIGDLGITAVDAQWLTTAFMLTMAVVIPTTGFLLNRFSTRARRARRTCPPRRGPSPSRTSPASRSG